MNIPLDFLPSIEIPKSIVSISYPGLPPSEVRQLLTIPLEDALSSLRGIKEIYSVSKEGSSVIELTFHWGKDKIFRGKI